MKPNAIWRRNRFRVPVTPQMGLQLLLILLWFAAPCRPQEENFNCHSGGGLIFTGDKTLRAAIIPRGDINIDIGKSPVEVLCRFNSSNLNVDNVFFTTQEGPVPHEVVNSSTIRVLIEHSEPTKYTLYCKLRKGNSAKELCSQTVKAGVPPLDVEDFSCVAFNNEEVNCSWATPFNPVKTMYTNLTVVTGKYRPGECQRTNVPFYTWCFWDKSSRLRLTDEFDLLITRKNDLGAKTYSHHVIIPAVVYPNKVVGSVGLVGPVRAKVSWNLTYPLDVFTEGLFHWVQYRLVDTKDWLNVTYFFHEHSLSDLTPKRSFSVELNLPFAFAKYEFRVRIHTGYGQSTSNDLWSPYDILSIMTEPLPPSRPPKTSQSTFEVVEGLDNRDIYVYFQNIDPIYYSGNDFHLKMMVYPHDLSHPLDIEPSERSKSYFKYKFMNFTQYRFEIIPVNEVGEGELHSEMVVPNSDCMPKKTEMFTVITTSTPEGKMFSLYWVPSMKPNLQCVGANLDIDSYTIFWCKKTFGDRCKERLFWHEIGNPELVVKKLDVATVSPITIYEKNITDLPDNEVYTFGVAASTGKYSSGIRWSSCIVDDTEPPLPPVTDVAICTNKTGAVEVKWNLKCLSLSAVPLGFNVSYCKSDIPDFGHCTSPVQNEKINSPAAASTIISNLEPGVSYIFSVSVLSLIGEGRQSVPKMMILRDEIPSGPPKNFVVESLSNSTAVFSWDPPEEKDQRGLITEYRINTNPFTWTTAVDALKHKKGETIKYEVKGLKPFTQYEVKVSACTKAGCGIKVQASNSFRTKAGNPSSVKNFNLDVSNWRLLWNFERCNSANCSFELEVPLNDSNVKALIEGNETAFNLRDLELECNNTKMAFFIRAKGQDDDGKFLFGNWSSLEKAEEECPKEGWALWVIGLIVTLCAILGFGILLVMKYGYSTVRRAVEDCKQNINLPKGIQVPEATKGDRYRRDFMAADGGLIIAPSEPSTFLRLHSPNSPTINFADSILRGEERGLTKLTNRDSVSSEEVNLIDDLNESHDRHGRISSGGSDHSSSGQDSAMMSGSPSVDESDPDASSVEIKGGHRQEESPEMTLRLRSHSPPYVQHGILTDKLPEGYVTAHSVPSLPHLYKEELDALQQSTPNLNSNLTFAGWINARRASTGYISMPDSENEYPVTLEPQPVGSLVRNTPSRVHSGLPIYSRYSFNPNLKSGLPAGYSDIMAIRTSSSPSSSGRSVGHVSAVDPRRALKRQPSLPLISKNLSIREEELPLSAYCKVGSRDNVSNSGYVTAATVGGTTPNRNPYVSYGEAEIISAGQNSKTSSPGMELWDGGRWAQPVKHHQPPFTNHHRSPGLASAPVEGSRGGRVGLTPRPFTTDAAMGHMKANHAPSLSKQSSGYVSQESFPPNFDAVVMSPKRLMTQAASPHSVLVSPSHQASMV